VRDLSPTEIAERGLAATVALRCGDRVGSGFLVERETVVTNAHVVCPGASALRVRAADGRETDGAVEKVEEALDLAVVRAPGLAGQPLPLGDAGGLKAGQRLTIVGSPVGMDFTVHQASVSNVDRRELGVALIQIDGQVNPGNSGGPLIDSEGRAVGIVSMMVRNARGLGLALPINYVYEAAGTGEVPLPLPAPDFRRWSGVLERVRAADERQLVEAEEAFKVPALGGAGIHPDGRVFAILVARGRPSGARVFRFRLTRDSDTLCTPSGLVETWDFYSRERGDATGDPRLFRWLERHGLSRDLYVGTAPLAWEGCPDSKDVEGAELTLPESPSGVRVALSPFRE
jgi:hypothetical protein